MSVAWKISIACLAFVSIASADRTMYWTEARGVRKLRSADLQGSNIMDLFSTPQMTPEGLAVDTVAGRLYWCDGPGRAIRAAALDGSNPVDIVVGLGYPRSIALDVINQKVYWADYSSQRIQRANLDGTSIETVVTQNASSLGGIAVNPEGGEFYWVNSSSIWKRGIQGGAAQMIVNNISSLSGIAFNPLDEMMYFSNGAGFSPVGKIRRCNTDGSGLEILVDQLYLPEAIAIDVQAGQIYWADAGTQRIQRALLDGTSKEDVLINGMNFVRGLAIAEPDGKVYWSDLVVGTIQRMNGNGTNYERILPEGFVAASQLARVDGDAHLFWTGPAAIQSCNLLEVDPMDVVSLISPAGIAVDPTGGRVYWTDLTSGSIRRATLDGASIESIVSNLDGPAGIAIHSAAGKIYWSESGPEVIRRADLNGANVEDVVVSGIGYPVGMLVDDLEAKLYWSDIEAQRIQRADLDGANIEDLVLGVESFALAIEPTSRKLYWGDRLTGRIERSNLDGSNVEVVLTTATGSVAGIAFGPEGVPAVQPFLMPVATALALLNGVYVFRFRIRCSHVGTEHSPRV